MLELKNISFSADGKQILRNINLTIDDAKFVVITGPNGGGKSTLAKVIAGIITPDSGQILLDGQDITDWSITERARAGVSFAFQQPVRFKGVTVKDLITLASGRDLSTAAACDYLAEVGLCAKDYIDREVNASLSGGELKRIEIATVMARKTKLTLFDEPEAGIDLWSFKNLIDVFEKMHDEIQASILIISHQERILNIADQVVVISGGEISQIGTKEEVLPGLFGIDTGCRYFQGGNA
ncbi:MAG TPA: ATP-binding cassette domain-containing protein [Candidatus Anaerotignum merdipullorum]|nr:ATP-binding cassette domain-containing protein [Candidatus Anaerotignum merdipullorum]